MPSVAADWASFKSFYQAGWLSTWWSMGLGTLAGTAAAVAAAPAGTVVAALGSGIGSTLGLSGAAATRLGMAVLGSGSAAGGGASLPGGGSLLAAALSFSSEVVIDYSATRGVRAYQYQQFREASHGMMHLPFPISDSGSPRYREAIRRLGSIDFKTHTTPLAVMGTAEFRSAVDLLRSPAESLLSTETAVREATLLALLELYGGDYLSAGRTARSALETLGEARHRVTVLHFIEATSMLAEERPDFERSFAAFERSVLDEPENPLASVVFAVYLDRLVTRMNDRAVPDEGLHEIHELAGQVRDERQRAVIRIGVLSRYLIRIKQEQQVIRSMLASKNPGLTADEPLRGVVERANGALAGLISAAQDRAEEFKEMHCLRTFVRERCQQLYELADALDAYAREQPDLHRQVDSWRAKLGESSVRP